MKAVDFYKLNSGKKEMPLKTKTTDYCHARFIQLCRRFFNGKTAEGIRFLAVAAIASEEHPRFEEFIEKAMNSNKNEIGLINDIINSYLDNNVVSIEDFKSR